MPNHSHEAKVSGTHLVSFPALDIAAECIKMPGQTSVWSKAAAKYVCAKDAEYERAVAEHTPTIAAAHPPINPAFKLVFLTSVGGTVLFIAICAAIHWATGGAVPPTTQKFVDGLFSMAQIGFGAIVGLLGGQVLRGVDLHPN
jgi:hypothetical protein